MMTIDIKKRMYRNIALLIFLLLTSIVAAFANEADAIGLSNQKVDNIHHVMPYNNIL